MSLLANLKTDESIENETDRTGGYGPVDSGLYECTVDMAYLNESAGGALALNLTLKTNDNRQIRETLWLSSGEAKGKKNYYVTKDGEKKYLPGFQMGNALALLTVGKEISELSPEEKVLKIWSSEAKAEVPTKVPVLTELLGQPIIAGVLLQKENKRVNDGSGKWVDSAETRDVNVVDKFFRQRDRLTTAEVRAQAEEAVYINTWDSNFSGTVRDRSTTVSNTTGQSSGAFTTAAANAPSTGTEKPTQSLFG